MWNRRLAALCLMGLFLTPTGSFQIGGLKGGSISDLLTASIIGLALGRLRNRVRPAQQPQASANHQRPMFLPWQSPPQYPVMQPTHVIPSLHPQMVQPFFQDISPFLVQLGEEQMFAPTHLIPSVLNREAFDGLHAILDEESQVYQTLLRYGTR